MTDRELAELSQLSYLNLPNEFIAKSDLNEKASFQEFMEYCIEKPENMGISKGDYTYQLCQKYAQEQYKDLQILNYTNQNETNGYVGYALKDSSGNVVIASRGSESPGGEDTPEVSGVCGTMIDWIDNFRLPSTVQTDQQEAAKNFANNYNLENDSIIYKAKVKSKDVTAYVVDRDEYEIIVDYRFIKDIECIIKS